MKKLVLALVVTLLASAPVEVHAVECQRIARGRIRLEQVDAQVRIDWIRSHLRYGARRARLWHWLWFGSYGALATFNFALYPGASNTGDKAVYVIEGVNSLIGMAALAIKPLKIMRDDTWLERRLERAAPEEDRCALLADAERILLRDAENENEANGGLLHAGNFVINIAAGLVMGIAYKRWNQVALDVPLGIAIGEVFILSQPQHAVKDLKRYRTGQLEPVAPLKHEAASPVHVTVGPQLLPDGGGLVLSGAF